MDILTSSQFWIAVLSGGTAVKIIDYLLPHFLNRNRDQMNDRADERSNLREDINYLRGEIDKLRTEVGELRHELEVTRGELSIWQRRYWSKKTALDKIIAHVNTLASDEVRQVVLDAAAKLETEEESSQTHD